MCTFLKRLAVPVVALALACAAISSCDGLAERVEALETSVSDLKSISEYIQQVYRENKIVREVIQDGDSYILVFTDDTRVTIDNSTQEVEQLNVSSDGHAVIILLSDGTKYSIPYYYAVPSSVTFLSSKPVSMFSGASASVQLRISPSNAVFDTEDVVLEYDGANFALDSVAQNKDDGGKPVPGHFTATIRDLGVSSEYEEEAIIVISATDINGEKVSVYSSPITFKAVSYHGINTGLPFVIIDTPDGAPIVSKEDWMEGATMTILNPDLSVSYQGSLSVKGRGNSTWTQFPKKPYALKLDSKSEILGMKKHKRWCLLANWMDRTLIRNAVAFEISRKTELAWTPSGQFVELFLNGEHKGNYYLCEQVKVDENRVNITPLKKTSIEGGYLMEVDAWFDEVYKFRSPIHDVPWQFKDPDEVNDAQFAYMQNYVREFEESLYDDARFAARDYTNYIDCDSWVDWWLVNELAQNGDVNQPKSIYISKDVGGKLVAGPVWDFDWGTFIPVEFNPSVEKINYSCRGPKFYLNRICIEDPKFRALAKEHWLRYRSALAEIPAYIDSLAATLVASDAINIAMWPIDRTTNQDVTLSFADAVARLKQAYTEKFQWLDNIIINTY